MNRNAVHSSLLARTHGISNVEWEALALMHLLHVTISNEDTDRD